MTATVLHAPAAAARRPGLRRAAIALSALGAALVTAGALLALANAGTALPDGTDWRLAAAGAVAFLAFGGLLAIRMPGNAVSWIALAAGSRRRWRSSRTSTRSTRCSRATAARRAARSPSGSRAGCGCRATG